jgi:hypothetical protein
MPVTGGSAKKKDRILLQYLTAQKLLVSTARILLSHVDSPYPIFYIVTINLTTLMKSNLITKHSLLSTIVRRCNKHGVTSARGCVITILVCPDERWALETCREWKINKNIFKEISASGWLFDRNENNFIHLIIFIFHFVKHFTTKFKPLFVTIAQSLYQL